MITKTTNYYTIKELENDFPESLEKAIDKNRDINVNYEWWDCVYCNFKMICESVGITIKENQGGLQIFFSGFYSQGDGSYFTSKVDEKAFLNALEAQAWKEHIPNDAELDNCFFALSTQFKRLKRLIDNDWMWLDVQSYCTYRNNHHTTYNYDIIDDREADLDRVCTQAEKLCESIEQCLQSLNDWLYSKLLNEYEHLTNNKVVKETLISNEYHFNLEGELI